jgi:putative aldouronate transport system permease protein
MKHKLSIGDIAFNILNYLVFAIFALICIFPFYYILINSISNNELVTQGKILFFPSGIHFANYEQVVKINGLWSAALVSLARTVIGTIFSIVSASFLGYALSKEEYWNRKFWYKFIVITMYFNAGVIPWYINMKTLGLTNSFLGYILPALVSPFNMILVKTYVESIPASLEESAEIDGASHLSRFIHIIFPLAKPIVATIAVFSAVGQWNSFMDTVFLVSDKNLFTLQYILYQYLNEVNTIADNIRRNPSLANVSAARQLTPLAVRFTISIVTVLPILLVYPFFQRYFVKGIMIGAVKG